MHELINSIAVVIVAIIAVVSLCASLKIPRRLCVVVRVRSEFRLYTPVNLIQSTFTIHNIGNRPGFIVGAEIGLFSEQGPSFNGVALLVDENAPVQLTSGGQGFQNKLNPREFEPICLETGRAQSVRLLYTIAHAGPPLEPVLRTIRRIRTKLLISSEKGKLTPLTEEFTVTEVIANPDSMQFIVDPVPDAKLSFRARIRKKISRLFRRR